MTSNSLLRSFRAQTTSRLPRGDALRFAQRLPLAFIFRAFGAQSIPLRLSGKAPGRDDKPLVPGA
jgi:hypothetical protein